MIINGLTKIVGLIGYPIDYTLSPIMHNVAFNELNLNFVYLPFRVKLENLHLATQGLVALNIVGANVTIPHKEEIIKYLHHLSQEADIIGAVNTICVHEGRLIGDNTDGKGFVTSLREEMNIDPAGKKVFILGAGGASRAIAVSLAKLGVKRITLTDKEMIKAERLSSNLRQHFPNIWFDKVGLKDKEFEEHIKDCDILINATPCGMHENDPLLIKADWLFKNQIVYDLIYTPPQTSLLRLAKEKGCKIQNGISMLVHQGTLSFELWTGKKAPIEVMRKTIENMCA